MMFFGNSNEKIIEEINNNYIFLEQIKNMYKNKIEMYKKFIHLYDNKSTELSDIFSKTLNNLDFCEKQIVVIDENEQQIQDLLNNANAISKTLVKIIYFGQLYKTNSQNVEIVYGIGKSWKNQGRLEMQRTEQGFEVQIEIEFSDTFYFCFTDENNCWDNNNRENYSLSKRQNAENTDNYSVIIENTANLSDEFNRYQEKYKNIKNNYFNQSIYEENIMMEYIQTQMNVAQAEESMVKDNGVLLISEVQNKVILPYTGKEVTDILNNENNDYQTADDVINTVFTRPFNYYKNQFVCRFKEAVDLVTTKEHMSLRDGINLGTELCKKRYLHPAIISACKTIDELDVYLDCLDKNELDDFKIFEIKYELHPTVVKENNIFNKILSFFNKNHLT